jgi:hypothetical protein
MYTGAASRSVPDDPDDPRATVTTLTALHRSDWTASRVRAQLRARRWQRVGRAVVLHNGQPSTPELRRAALLNCGPRAALTAFTAAEELGLRSWERPEIHVLVPGGTHVTRVPGLPTRVHYVGRWAANELLTGRDLHRAAPALVLAASTFARARPACGLLAAGVQQRLVTAAQLHSAVAANPRLRHRHAMQMAVQDIAQGAGALSEIDFVRLCRRYGLPLPEQQAVRVDRSGRRRYLDAAWTTRTGRRLVAEIDGALHLAPRRWWDDQLRQNELVLGGDLVLRFPTVLVRHEEQLVVAQLRRGLSL